MPVKFLHVSDLHFGKMLHRVSLLEDQSHWVDQLLALTEEVRPDAVVIAGDVYDRSMPPGDATQLLSRMVTGLAGQGIPVLMVAGNHDSGQRLACFREILARGNVHISGEARGDMAHATLRDAYGPVTFWLMPYVYPAAVAEALGCELPKDYDAAVRALLEAQPVDYSERNVIVAHQYVTSGGAEGTRGGSESMVAGVGQVDMAALEAFDYAALGHIHAAYPVGREYIRYAGSPLCYHFNELRQARKGPVLVELFEKGAEPRIETKLLEPLHPLREWSGTAEELYEATKTEAGRGEYVRLVLQGQRMTPEISAYYHSFFDSRGSVLMECVSEYQAFSPLSRQLDAAQSRAVEELFADFYAARRQGCAPDGGEYALMREAGELLRRGVDDAERLLEYALTGGGQA